jgi:FkbM family methyltransferase
VSGYNTYYSLRKGDIVIDAGAYTGLYTVYAAKKVGSKGKVIAYEPDPYTMMMLKKNIKLNQLSNVTLVRKGLFDKNDSVPFDIQSVGSNIVTINTAFHNRKTINKVNVAPLDEEVVRLRLNTVDFIKMDIEGAEIEAMKGARTTIKKNKNISLAIASYHVVNGRKTYIFLEKFFKKLNMNTKTELNGQLTTYSSYKKLARGN